MTNPKTQSTVAVLVLGAIITAAPPSRAQEFWHGTARGMTVAQVLAATPGARELAYPGTVRTGTVELLMDPGVLLGGESFTAHFYFASGALQEVMLLLDGKRRYARLQPVYAELEKMFTTEYGAPASTRERSDSMLQSKSESWRSGRTEIGLAMLRGGDSANLNISYRVW